MEPSVEKAVECVLEGSARTEPCRLDWARIDEETLTNPLTDASEYKTGKVAQAEQACIEGAFWIGAHALGYTYSQARDMFRLIEVLFANKYKHSLASVNDASSYWTETSNGRDVALAKLKDLL